MARARGVSWRKWLPALAAFAVVMAGTPARATYDYGPNAVNQVPTVPFAPLPPSATQAPSGRAEPRVETTVPVPSLPVRTVRAGVGVVDATWKVGAAAGQYATDGTSVGDHGVDPTTLSTRRVPSYGIESRSTTRALVVEGVDGKRIAFVNNDLYIPQDLLDRRVAGLLKARDDAIKAGTLQGKPTGIDDSNMMISITHSHSSPYYSTMSWGVWAFQDVFDIRFFEFMATRMADAVVAASDALRPVRMGAETVPFDYTQRHSFGPAIADDGTPAGYPKRDNDLTISVLRFDDITDRAHPRPYANFFTMGQHPEMLEGNNLLTSEWVGRTLRMADVGTGAVNVFTQNNTGTTEPDRSESHAPAVRAEFSHREYAQAERAARQIANAVIRATNEIGTDRPSVPSAYVPYRLDFEVDVKNQRFAPPYSHPYSSVSNCRTEQALNGNPGIPVVGLPDCQRPVGGALPRPPVDPGVTLSQLGVPLPSNYPGPAYTGLEEALQVHLQAYRLGDILVTVCPCEQWADQSRNIKSRADKVQGNIWLGYDWTQWCKQSGGAGTNWKCPNPDKVSDWNGDPSNPPADAILTIPGSADANTDPVLRMRAQVNNPADGWDSLANATTAESEPFDITKIWGNYTHTELDAAHGYKLVVPVGMANDYWGYIATYREYSRGDHYRKALTGLGPHSSDWLATRLVALGGAMKGDPASIARITPQTAPEQAYEAAFANDDEQQRQRADVVGRLAESYLPAYEAALPPDGGEPGALTQPGDIERFDVATFAWRGGSNFFDSPVVHVEREVSPGQWVTQGDAYGDVQAMVSLPQPADLPSYRAGSFEWKWTAYFEAFDSDIDTAMFGNQTPAGTYRFVVDGNHRTGQPPAGSRRPYRVVSKTFQVKPWSGITVPSIALNGDNTVSFSVGPVEARKYSRDYPAGTADLGATVGPIAYPSSWPTAKLPTSVPSGNKVFPRLERTMIAGQQRYCFSCSFRPWVETGQVQSASVVVTRPSGCTVTVPATRQPDGSYRTATALGPGESARVVPGGVRDTFGEYNGAASAAVTRPGSAAPAAANTGPCLPASLPNTRGAAGRGGAVILLELFLACATILAVGLHSFQAPRQR
jgi:hypothetical protein